MRLSQLLGERMKQTPSECTTANHTFMVRGGYIKQMSSGIYSLFMPGKRVCRKIENIIREEMDKIDGQEVQFPVVMPSSIWEESDRYYTVGSEMARFTDRSGSKLVLGMTHEEAAVHLARDVASSYNDYPFMIYQIQTKFRDEPRSRGGLVRVREFTMKDAYSFHTSAECLDSYYERCLDSYNKIYARVGLPEVISVKSDTGMMGGSGAHEFIFLADIGEDSIAICQNCDYKANVEASDCIIIQDDKEDSELMLVETPDCKTIDDLCGYLSVSEKDTCKAVVYCKNEDDSYVIVFLRGDREVNETKLCNYLGCDVHTAAEITADSGIVAGFIGPVELDAKAEVIYDKSLEGARQLVCGANEVDMHYKGMSAARDLPCGTVFVDVSKSVDGDICPVCGKPSIAVKRGIEVGNIFKLGKKYTDSMNMTYQDNDGTLKTPIMGCYGIGVGRLAACILEKHHDDYGPIWPISVAPWHVHICALSITKDEKVKDIADGIYSALNEAGVEVVYDDRKMSNGAMFADADLLGCPVRIVVSPRNCSSGVVEISARDKSFKEEVAYSENDYGNVVAAVREKIAKMFS
ncbi:MAG: proline--tRNA ligase [Lachnospiraceae bacterium]|nr:proline--tRNA ligase [Lachnospiraceae bacterium]